MGYYGHIGIRLFMLAKERITFGFSYQESVTDGFSQQKEWQYAALSLTMQYHRLYNHILKRFIYLLKQPIKAY